MLCTDTLFLERFIYSHVAGAVMHAGGGILVRGSSTHPDHESVHIPGLDVKVQSWGKGLFPRVFRTTSSLCLFPSSRRLNPEVH